MQEQLPVHGTRMLVNNLHTCASLLHAELKCAFLVSRCESQVQAELTMGRVHHSWLLREEWIGECAERGRGESGSNGGMFLSPTDHARLPSPGPCCKLPGSGFLSRGGS